MMLTTVKPNQRRVPFFFPELEHLTNHVFGETDTTRVARPSANISEHENHYSVSLAAPGFKKEDFNIKVEKDLLTIAVKREDEKAGNEKVVRQEFKVQNFERTFHLTEKINGEQIAASYENGLLEVTLAKKAEVKPEIRTISVA